MKPDKPYAGDIGTVIKVNCGKDISAGTSFTLLVKNPLGTLVVWTGALLGTNHIQYTTISGDFIEGDYKLQSKVILPSGEWKGKTASFKVWGNYE